VCERKGGSRNEGKQEVRQNEKIRKRKKFLKYL
jgi:hypothetical protein